MYTVFKTHGDVDDGYLYRLLKTEHYRQIFAASTNSSVDRRGSLRWKDFQRIHIPLPPIAQQHAIVELLDHADRDTELIRRQLNSLRAEKAALMQQLLTGKRRVRIPKAIAKAA
jgi:type I restriction enzyme S subunit